MSEKLANALHEIDERRMYEGVQKGDTECIRRFNDLERLDAEYDIPDDWTM